MMEENPRGVTAEPVTGNAEDVQLRPRASFITADRDQDANVRMPSPAPSLSTTGYAYKSDIIVRRLNDEGGRCAAARMCVQHRTTMRHSHSPETERRMREAALDETLAASFPASDAPSTLPNPDDDSVDAFSTTNERDSAPPRPLKRQRLP